MAKDDYEEEFVDEEDELFNDEEDKEDDDEDESCTPEEEGFLKGYKEAGKKTEDEEEDE